MLPLHDIMEADTVLFTPLQLLWAASEPKQHIFKWIYFIVISEKILISVW